MREKKRERQRERKRERERERERERLIGREGKQREEEKGNVKRKTGRHSGG